MDKVDISKIISYLNNTCNVEQQREVENIFNYNFISKEEYKDFLITYLKLRYKNKEENFNSNSLLKIKSKLNKPNVKKRRFLQSVVSIASVLLITIGSIILLLEQENQIYDNKIDFACGQSKAVLKLSNGKQIELNKNKKIQLNEGSAIVKNNKDNLQYSESDNKNQVIKFNSIYIPKGGEYKLTLSDGTRVWINSDTKIKYPVVFPKNKREISVEGEIFLEVAKNRNSPFIVNSKNIKTKVLGTAFNVKCYDNEENIQITLVEGKVKVITKTESKNLTPGYMFDINKKSEKILKTKVDINEYIMWKDGIFYFNNMRLEEILVILNRWYKVEFFFLNDKIKDYRFSGKFRKKSSLNILFEFFKHTSDIKIDTKDKVILLYN